jgi:putative acetyltransferase
VDWTVRAAQPADRAGILSVVRQAFTGDGRDGQEEVDIVESTWKLAAAPEGLELVADHDGEVIGHALGARGDLAFRTQPSCTLVAVAPLGVAPAWQGRGIGQAVMRELLARAEAQGWPAVVLLGAPAYYGRFGFEASGPLGISYPPVGPDNPHFQVRRLSGFDSSLRGEFTYCWEATDTPGPASVMS